ncbi:hypothetical protein F4859DRAFT_527424 [Xylaria cf. heliscus]|nr:hypothetical protein F4859DRAFT_527424 [Xylaria cf. heliscus]
MSSSGQNRVLQFTKQAGHATTASFPQFPRLPLELRREVWGQFALPKKIYLRHDLMQITEVCLSDPEGSKKRMDIRRIMQVNTEARREVLRGHQLVMWVKPYDPLGHPKRNSSFSFVNWDLDLFSIIFNTTPEDRIKASSEPFNKIKNLAYGITRAFGAEIHPPQLIFESHSSYARRANQYEWSHALKSLERMVLIVPRKAMWEGLYIRPAEFLEERVDTHLRMRRVLRDKQEALINEYGLHTIDLETDRYGKCFTMFATGGEGYQFNFRICRFPTWVDMVVRREKEKLATYGKGDVECQVMLDHLGIRDGRLWNRNSQLGLLD